MSYSSSQAALMYQNNNNSSYSNNELKTKNIDQDISYLQNQSRKYLFNDQDHNDLLHIN